MENNKVNTNEDRIDSKSQAQLMLDIKYFSYFNNTIYLRL